MSFNEIMNSVTLYALVGAGILFILIFLISQLQTKLTERLVTYQ